MNPVPFIGLLMCFIAGACFAQRGSAAEKVALRSMEKGQWQKAEARLRKSLERDPLAPGVRVALSRFFFHRRNPAFDLDSAYRYAVTALDDYTLASARERERLSRLAIDSLALIALRARIDSSAFERARQQNTEAGYVEFLRRFPTAAQAELAVRLRDEVAYQAALADGSHHALFNYLDRYPTAERAAEARARYAFLLYEDATRDGRLSSYKSFLSAHPETPFREKIYGHIFELSTADGSVGSFLDFAARYPESELADRARRIVFHILAEEEHPAWPRHFLDDSLSRILTLNRRYLVAVLEGDRYGFINATGEEVLPPQYHRIPDEYRCGHITDDILMADDRLLSRNGATVYEGTVDHVRDVGAGFLAVSRGNDLSVVHKGGFVVARGVQDARVVASRYLALRKNDRWFLHTLTGRLLDGRGWSDISFVSGVIALQAEGKVFITTVEGPGKCAGGNDLSLSSPLDEVRPWSRSLLWGRAGAYEGVLDSALRGFIGFDQHKLSPTSFGATAETPNGWVVYNGRGQRSPTFDSVKISGSQVGVKKQGRWHVYHPGSQRISQRGYDSISVQGAFLLGLMADSVFIHFTEDNVLSLPGAVDVTFIPGKDSTCFLRIAHAERSIIFNRLGRKLFSAPLEGISYAGDGVFVVTRKDGKGLMDAEGSILLPPRYDAIGSPHDNIVSLLKDQKFGAYHLVTRTLVNAEFDRNPRPYNTHLLTAYKNGFYGFLRWDGKAVSAFVFDEVIPWSDSVALVKQGQHWQLYDIFTRKTLEDDIRKVWPIGDSDGQKTAIIQQRDRYGVISSRKGTVIPATFTDIINVGSADDPLYFTEKDVREASLRIVIYYDADGVMLRKAIYESALTYDKIYCSDQ